MDDDVRWRARVVSVHGGLLGTSIVILLAYSALEASGWSLVRPLLVVGVALVFGAIAYLNGALVFASLAWSPWWLLGLAALLARKYAFYLSSMEQASALDNQINEVSLLAGGAQWVVFVEIALFAHLALLVAFSPERANRKRKLLVAGQKVLGVLVMAGLFGLVWLGNPRIAQRTYVGSETAVGGAVEIWHFSFSGTNGLICSSWEVERRAIFVRRTHAPIDPESLSAEAQAACEGVF